MHHDTTYLQGLQYILDNGVPKTDRTGVGTVSVIGMMLRYNLRDGSIPLLTSKKLPIKTIINELLWFISGTGSVKPLHNNGIKIWDEWATEHEHLNYLYGYQWRYWPSMFCSKKEQKVPNKINFKCPEYDLSKHIDEETKKVISWNGVTGYCNNHNLIVDNHLEYDVWVEMLEVVGDDSNNYTVHDEWLLFDNFCRDMRYLPGYLNMVELYGNETILTPKWYNSTVYSKWTTAFCHFEWILPDINTEDEYIVRPRLFHDQLQDAIDLIKNDPFCRRIIVNSWNVDLLDRMQLPPCHFEFQFINSPIEGGIETSLKLDMRSNDYCIGNPFNIAQYAILLRMVCHLCGTKPGDLIFSGADVHVYTNHIEGAKEQLTRDFEESPKLSIIGMPRNIDDFELSDFMLSEYNPKPFIKFPIAV